MPAHRRTPRLEPVQSQQRAAAGKRRAAEGAHRQLTMLTGMAVLGAVLLVTPAVLNAGWDPLADLRGDNHTRMSGVPADAPELGLVYQDLAVAQTGAPCDGTYQLVSRETCSHGPDPAPPGLVVGRDVPPVAPDTAAPAPLRRETEAAPRDADVVRDEGGVTPSADAPAVIADPAPGDEPFAVGQSGVACTGDGRTGKRVQVLYLHEFGTPSRYTQYLRSFRAWAGGVDAVFAASAAETGGVRRLRYVTTPTCEVEVTEVQVPAGALATLETNIQALGRLGYNRTDRKYLIFADAKVYCGISTFVGDRRPGRGNRNNGGPSYARTDPGCWSAAVAAHELTHSLGGVLDNAPHSTGDGHCTDGYDIMCYEDSSKSRLKVVCGDKNHQRRLDCNHDDYFHTRPKPGSFLSRNWNVADSDFLLREAPPRAGPVLPPDPGKPAPPESPGGPPADPGAVASGGPPSAADGEPSAAPDPAQSDPAAAGQPGGTDPQAPSSAEPTAGETPGPATGSAPPAAEPAPARPPAQLDGAPAPGPELKVSSTTSTSARLAWTAAKRGTRYAVTVDDRVLTITEAAAARLIGLRPATSYRVEIRLADAAGTRYTAPVNARTAPAAQPAPGTWFVLTNSLTSSAADLYAARSAAATPLVLNRTESGAQQLWLLRPAGNGSFQMVSKASGKCVIPLRSNPVVGTPLVQGTCAEGATTQNWWVERADHGFTLRTALGNLVVGLGNQRFGGSRVLVLQEPDRSRQQSWAAVPA